MLMRSLVNAIVLREQNSALYTLHRRSVIFLHRDLKIKILFPDRSFFHASFMLRTSTPRF